MRRLHAIPYSPWSEKARWALDALRVTYREQPYLPLLSEPPLRVRLGRWRGRVSVPILEDASGIYEDSLVIAEHADALRGDVPSLFDSDRDAIRDWARRSDAALSAGRTRTTRAVLRDPQAQVESLPPAIPQALRGRLGVVAKLAGHQLLKKYGAEEIGALEDALEATRDALDGGDYLVGDRFSFADIAMCCALEFVSPKFPFPPAARRAWTDPRLAERYADLLAWRDRIRAQHRPPAS